MHKTGSSAIQEYFSRIENDTSFSYAPYNTPNHCGLFALLTHPEPTQYHGFKKRGMTLEEAADEKLKIAAAFTRFLSSASGKVIFSAEDIALSPLTQIEKFRHIVRPFFDDIKVYIYIRPPKSYIESAFQQLLKEGDIDGLKIGEIWPSYTSIIGRLDRVFGRESVKVRYYHRPQLRNNSIVDDFAEWIGAPEPTRRMQNINSSLSAEAIALLFLQRKLGGGLEEPSKGVQERNSRWIDLLGSIGSQKFSFSDELIGPWLDLHKSDIKWLEDRVGDSIPAEAQKKSFEVSGPEDLLKLATENTKSVEHILLNRLKEGSSDQRERLVRMLELLRSML